MPKRTSRTGSELFIVDGQRRRLESRPLPFRLSEGAKRCASSCERVARCVGSSAVAALKNGRHAYGCDLDKRYIEVAREFLPHH
jgi:hypothetical protein